MQIKLLPEQTEKEILWKYSTVVAIHPLSRMICAPLFGYLYNKIEVVRPIGFASAALSIVGYILFSILSVIPSSNGRYFTLLISRFLTGASGGNDLFNIVHNYNKYINAIAECNTRTHDN